MKGILQTIHIGGRHSDVLSINIRSVANNFGLTFPISTLELLKKFRDLDPWIDKNNIHWYQPIDRAIQRDKSTDIWHAGRVTDIITLKSGAVIVASDTGGIWMISSLGDAVLLSNFENNDINCLARGLDFLEHIYAGCGSGGRLYETKSSLSSTLWNWREIVINDTSGGIWDTGDIYSIAVLDNRKIVLACYNGIFWSDVPRDHNNYVFSLVHSIPNGHYCGLARGTNNSVVVCLTRVHGWEKDEKLYGIFRCEWNLIGNDLILKEEGTITGLDKTKMWRTSLASCDRQRDIMYAVASKGPGPPDNEWMYGVLISIDGGKNWNQLATKVIGKDVPLESNDPDIAGGQGSFNNCIAVCPTDSNKVAIGWRNGPYISTDGGSKWNRYTDIDNKHLHADLHAVYFDPNDETGNRLYIGSDGGIVVTHDLGSNFISNINKHLLNLQFYGISASSQITGLIAGFTQDNGNLFGLINDDNRCWKIHKGGDGVLMSFLADGRLLHENNTAPQVEVATWDSINNHFQEIGKITSYFIKNLTQTIKNSSIKDSPISILSIARNLGMTFPISIAYLIKNGSGSDATDFHTYPTVKRIPFPLKKNSLNQIMYALANGGEKWPNIVFGIFANQEGQGMHYEFLWSFTLELGDLSTLASKDGVVIFIGTNRGIIFKIDTISGRINMLPVSILKDLFYGDDDTIITNIVIYDDNLAFATVSRSKNTKNYVLRWNGSTWNRVGQRSILPDNKIFNGIEIDWSANPIKLFIATDNILYVSQDNGDEWSIASNGLPKNPHNTHLYFVFEPTGRKCLYLSTYGRSVWRANLNA
jgi:hypothetical protein